jgi:hypothetical protein
LKPPLFTALQPADASASRLVQQINAKSARSAAKKIAAERIEAAPRVVQHRRNPISPHPRGSNPIRRSHIAVADARHKPSNMSRSGSCTPSVTLYTGVSVKWIFRPLREFCVLEFDPQRQISHSIVNKLLAQFFELISLWILKR